ncbi:MAG: hypothetical protein KGL15_05280 [Acidobacteriota bacterium]|nr:hypothetical protein [Acidobacteriota bacterium]
MRTMLNWRGRAVALAATLAALIGGSVASVAPASASSASQPVMTTKAVAFHDAMRELWQVHGTFTERAIVDYVGGLPDTTAVIAHLQQNQVQIGDAVKPYYGAKAGDELTALLHQHISDAVNCVIAAKAGNRTALASAEAAFSANANQTAAFLHSANPRNWSLSAMRSMMRTHINQVLGLAVDQLEGKYTAAINLYGTYIHHILHGMADMLSNGIIKQFPAKFR